VRKAVTWTSLASGEHLYTPWPFRQMIERRCLDILQPDIHWVGGLTACVKIAHMAEAAGLEVILHGGGSVYGLHFTAAMPNAPWAEFYIGSAPGVPLEAARRFPGSSIPKDGEVRPNDGPGFGVEVKEEWLEPFF
jgi:L-rhamnonate dehydratase